jgi:hypothetical protein
LARGLFFECENCKAKVFNELPAEWMHISFFSVQVGKGCFAEKDDLDYRYQTYRDLTFCSMSCFFEWFKNKYPQYQNPSQRI